LTSTVTRAEAGTAWISLAGELDRSSAAHLGVAVSRLLAERPCSLVLNLAGLRFLDVAGVRALASTRAHCAAQGCQFDLEQPQPFVLRVLRLTDQWQAA
jgi:anti-sigma B factor antagonist